MLFAGFGYGMEVTMADVEKFTPGTENIHILVQLRLCYLYEDQIQDRLTFRDRHLVRLVSRRLRERARPVQRHGRSDVRPGTERVGKRGTVTYRERIALTPGATLEIELRDVSYADAPAPLIARQTISGPGQVPIKFKVEYNREDIDSRNRYSVSAQIIESDGRLAFTNDTAYEVITDGNPNKVYMLLVLIQPPLNPTGDSDTNSSDRRAWVEVPVLVVWANLIPNEAEHLLRVAYYQSTIEGCARRGNQELKLDGSDIIVRVTLMQPPPTSWAIPCHEQVVELDAVEPIGASLELGQTYRVIVNNLETTTFTLPMTNLRDTFIAESPVDSWEVVKLESEPPQYQLHVVSGMPKGSRCSQFNGYEIRRRESNRINVVITLFRA